ncbi:MAG TPA: DUF6526 family protein [Bryobacteraceae bacterium]|jgi:hypothetical protein|nr:DUF6526 family protein [Bryobacteraceae bacterium]
MEEQSYAKHSRVVPLFHIGLGLLTLIAIVVSLINLYRHATDSHGRATVALLAVLSIALFLLFFFTRAFATKNQDRTIRAEENLRHYMLTGKPLDPRLTLTQIVGLRFASDAEFPDLARKAADDGLSRDAIKKSVRQWRADLDRV